MTNLQQDLAKLRGLERSGADRQSICAAMGRPFGDLTLAFGNNLVPAPENWCWKEKQTVIPTKEKG